MKVSWGDRQKEERNPLRAWRLGLGLLGGPLGAALPHQLREGVLAAGPLGAALPHQRREEEERGEAFEEGRQASRGAG